jgi:uncharacterized protein YebE (UPF0316 family)
MISIATIVASNWYDYLILPLFIFIARILDVSMGTVRVIFITRGFRIIAPLIGFFEILIWLMAAGQIFNDMSNWVIYIAYAGGFAAGTYIGIRIEEKLSVGKVMVRIISHKDPKPLIERLKKEEYTITMTQGQGAKGEVKIILTIIDRKYLKEVIEIIKEFNPHAFYSVEDMRFVNEKEESPSQKSIFSRMGLFKKSK